MFRLILWDVDGTLLDFHASQQEAIRACFRLHGLGECTEEMLSVYNGINIKYWEKLERKECTKEECLEGRFYEFFERFGVPTDRVKAFNDSYQVTLGDYPVFNEGAMETMKRIREKKIPQFAVTNGTKIAQNKKLRTTGLIDVFDEVFISDEIGFEKPDPRFFAPVLEAAEKHVPGIKKEEILLVGDSLTSDMKGGKAIGVKTCWYRTEEKAKKEHEAFDYEISDLRGVPELI